MIEGWLAAAAWQSALLIAAVWTVDRVCGDRVWPHLRHALWLVVAMKLALPPSLTAPWALLPASTAGGVAAPPFAGPLAAAWLAGACACAALGVRAARRRRRSLAAGRESVPPVLRAAFSDALRTLGVRHAPRLWISRAASGPCVFGCRRPVVVLPAGLAQSLSPVALRHVLLHEAAHVARRDLWLQAAFEVLRAVYWFHPGVWIARARAAALREICCDLAVVRALGRDAPSYRDTLAAFARRALAEPAPGAAGFLLGPATIVARLRALDRGHVPTWRRRLVTLGVALALGLFAVPIRRVPSFVPPDGLVDARRDLTESLGARDTAGSIQMRFAVLRVHALQQKQETR